MSATTEKLDKAEEDLLRQMQGDEGEVQYEEAPRESEETPRESAEQPVEQPQHEPESEAKIDRRALDDERRRRRQIEAEKAELSRSHAAELAKVQTRLEMLAQAAEEHLKQRQPAVEQTPIPDFNTDPAASIQHQFKSMDQRLAEMQARVVQAENYAQQQQRMSQEQSQTSDLERWALSQEGEYATQVPDYREAMAYLQQARRKTVEVMGITNPVDVQAAVRNDVLNMANFARQKGMNFAEVLYNLAAAHGYRKGGGDAETAAAAPAAAPAVTPPNTAAERLIRGRDMATTLSATGAAPRGPLSADTVGKMSDREFNKFYEATLKEGPEAIRNLLGR